MDDEILLGCKNPDDRESNLDLKPVTQLDSKTASRDVSPKNRSAKSRGGDSRLSNYNTQTTRHACNRVHRGSQERVPIVVLSQEARREQLARALKGEKNQFSYQLSAQHQDQLRGVGKHYDTIMLTEGTNLNQQFAVQWAKNSETHGARRLRDEHSSKRQSPDLHNALIGSENSVKNRSTVVQVFRGFDCAGSQRNSHTTRIKSRKHARCHKHHPTVNPNRKLMQAVRGLPASSIMVTSSIAKYAGKKNQTTSNNEESTIVVNRQAHDSIEGASMPSHNGSLLVPFPQNSQTGMTGRGTQDTKDGQTTAVRYSTQGPADRSITENSLIMNQRFSQQQNALETSSQYMADFIDIQTAMIHQPEVNGQTQMNLASPMVFRARLKSRASDRRQDEKRSQQQQVNLPSNTSCSQQQQEKQDACSQVVHKSTLAQKSDGVEGAGVADRCNLQGLPQQPPVNRTCARRSSKSGGKKCQFMHVHSSTPSVAESKLHRQSLGDPATRDNPYNRNGSCSPNISAFAASQLQHQQHLEKIEQMETLTEAIKFQHQQQQSVDSQTAFGRKLSTQRQTNNSIMKILKQANDASVESHQLENMQQLKMQSRTTDSRLSNRIKPSDDTSLEHRVTYDDNHKRGAKTALYLTVAMSPYQQELTTGPLSSLQTSQPNQQVIEGMSPENSGREGQAVRNTAESSFFTGRQKVKKKETPHQLQQARNRAKNMSPMSILKNLKSIKQRTGQQDRKLMTPIERILSQTQSQLQARSQNGSNCANAKQSADVRVASLSREKKLPHGRGRNLLNSKKLSGFDTSQPSHFMSNNYFAADGMTQTMSKTMQGLNSVSFKKDMKPVQMEQIGIYSLGQVSSLINGMNALSHATATTIPGASFCGCSSGLNCKDQATCGEPSEHQKFGQNFFLDRVNQLVDDERAKAKSANAHIVKGQRVNTAANNRSGIAKRPVSIATATNANVLNLIDPASMSPLFTQLQEQRRGRPQTQSGYYRSSGKQGQELIQAAQALKGERKRSSVFGAQKTKGAGSTTTKTYDEVLLKQHLYGHCLSFEEGAENRGVAALLQQNARQKIERFLKIQHVRTSAVPKIQALSSNQTLAQDGFSSKDHITTSKILNKNNQGSPKLQVNMNADLTMVNEVSQDYFKLKVGTQKVNADFNTGYAAFTISKDVQQTMELDPSKVLSDANLMSQESKQVLNTTTSPTQPKPFQIPQIADQFQESFANYNWMSPRIVEHPQPQVASDHFAPAQAVQSLQSAAPKPIQVVNQADEQHLQSNHNNSSSGGGTQSQQPQQQQHTSNSGQTSARFGSVEGLHGKRINLLTPADHNSNTHGRASHLQHITNDVKGVTGAANAPNQGVHLQKVFGVATLGPNGKSYSLQVPPMKINDQHQKQHQTLQGHGACVEGTTLRKNDSLHSNRLFQVTEQNSENQSMLIAPSQLQNHIVTANLQEYAQSQKSLSQVTSAERSSVLFAELSRLEKELKERGASPLMKRETTLDRLKRSQAANSAQKPNNKPKKHQQQAAFGVHRDELPGASAGVGASPKMQVVGWRTTKPSTYELPAHAANTATIHSINNSAGKIEQI